MWYVESYNEHKYDCKSINGGHLRARKNGCTDKYGHGEDIKSDSCSCYEDLISTVDCVNALHFKSEDFDEKWIVSEP